MSVAEHICKNHCLCPVCVKYSKCKRCENKSNDITKCLKIACLSFKQKKGTKL